MNSTSRKIAFSDAAVSASPATKPTASAASGIASHSVARTRESAMKFTTSSSASIAAKLTRWAPTTESGTSWRGNRVFRIRFALSSIERVDDCSADATKVHTISPESRNSG